MRRRRYMGWPLMWVIVSGTCFAPCLPDASGSEPRPPFPVPNRLDLWKAQRAEIRKTTLQALGLSEAFARPEAYHVIPGRAMSLSNFAINQGRLERRPGLVIEPMSASTRSLRKLRFVIFRPGSMQSGERLPAVLFLIDKWVARMDNADEGEVNWGNIEPAYLAPALAECGYIVLVPVIRPLTGQPWLSRKERVGDGSAWESTLRDDKLALEILMSRKDIDPKRVGVAGFGRSGMRAWSLMALDERIACGIAVGGITRLSDWLSAERRDRRPLAPWAEALLATYDVEAVMALCAPRRLQIVGGDRDPLSPVSGIKVIRETVGRVYGLYNEGREFTLKLYEGSGGELTRQKWDSLVEMFAKEFQPRGATPRRHSSMPK